MSSQLVYWVYFHKIQSRPQESLSKKSFCFFSPTSLAFSQCWGHCAPCSNPVVAELTWRLGISQRKIRSDTCWQSGHSHSLCISLTGPSISYPSLAPPGTSGPHFIPQLPIICRACHDLEYHLLCDTQGHNFPEYHPLTNSNATEEWSCCVITHTKSCMKRYVPHLVPKDVIIIRSWQTWFCWAAPTSAVRDQAIRQLPGTLYSVQPPSHTKAACTAFCLCAGFFNPGRVFVRKFSSYDMGQLNITKLRWSETRASREPHACVLAANRLVPHINIFILFLYENKTNTPPWWGSCI